MLTYTITNDELLRLHATLLRRHGEGPISLPMVYGPGNSSRVTFAHIARRAMEDLSRMGLAKPLPKGTTTIKGSIAQEPWQMVRRQRAC